eukprot:7883-Heterococcus_DN1.PRE.2
MKTHKYTHNAHNNNNGTPATSQSRLSLAPALSNTSTSILKGCNHDQRSETSVATALLQMKQGNSEDAAARKRRLSREANQRWRQKADVKERERKRAAVNAPIRAAKEL